ncbi:MmgE/PrpD family protein [Variovorax sp. RA8]|uniref:MmgE/PrpD family protein n=1 Tax=Variovorax sp. (strain JCM 16519 / RA8) TaxID=662548 RepID=UPI001318E4A2|nr:2-methylcitrate dehydratase [Variovorax sp. RA8]
MQVMTQPPGTQTEQIARFALGLQLCALPPKVLALAKRHLLDTLGIAVASTGFDFGKVTLDAVQPMGHGEDASAIGSGLRLPAPSAALLNATLAHGLDYDDTHIGGVYHASAAAMGAAFAAGQASGANGSQVLVAYVAAMEVGCRIAIAGAGELTRRGFHPTAVCGAYAATVAAGMLYGLDERALVHALGLAGSMSAGMLEMGDSWLKRLHPGWAAHAGVTAALFGRAGFVGPTTSMDGTRGFYATHVGRMPQPEEMPAFALGGRWRVLDIALKPYPCCHIIHAFVDAALELREQFDVGDVERIECPLVLDWHKLIAEPRAECVQPTTPYRALFSMQYVVALALLRGRVELADFYDRPLQAPDILALANKVWCIDDPLSDYPAHFPGELVIHLRDGRVLRCRKPVSLGTPESPLSQSALQSKYLSNATRVIHADAAQQLQELVMRIETLDSLTPMLALSVASTIKEH